MRIASGRLRLIASGTFFLGVAAAWLAGVPFAWSQTPIITKICSDGPLQKCREITTCEGNTRTTNYYYYL